MERFVMIVKGFQPLTFIQKCSILDVAAALDPPLSLLTQMVNWSIEYNHDFCQKCFKMLEIYLII